MNMQTFSTSPIDLKDPHSNKYYIYCLYLTLLLHWSSSWARQSFSCCRQLEAQVHCFPRGPTKTFLYSLSCEWTGPFSRSTHLPSTTTVWHELYYTEFSCFIHHINIHKRTRCSLHYDVLQFNTTTTTTNHCWSSQQKHVSSLQSCCVGCMTSCRFT